MGVKSINNEYSIAEAVEISQGEIHAIRIILLASDKDWLILIEGKSNEPDEEFSSLQEPRSFENEKLARAAFKLLIDEISVINYI